MREKHDPASSISPGLLQGIGGIDLGLYDTDAVSCLDEDVRSPIGLSHLQGDRLSETGETEQREELCWLKRDEISEERREPGLPEGLAERTGDRRNDVAAAHQWNLEFGLLLR